MTHAGVYVAAHGEGPDRRLRFQISFSQPEPPEEIRKASGSGTWGVCISNNRLNRKQQNVYGQIEKSGVKKEKYSKGEETRTSQGGNIRRSPAEL